jgi:hypothetical protein
MTDSGSAGDLCCHSQHGLIGDTWVWARKRRAQETNEDKTGKRLPRQENNENNKAPQRD